MPLKDEIRLKAELHAASVLLAALMRQTDEQDFRRVFDEVIVRETAHMLERGARSQEIRAFEDAAGEWSIRSRALRYAAAGAGERGNASRRPPRHGSH